MQETGHEASVPCAFAHTSHKGCESPVPWCYRPKRCDEKERMGCHHQPWPELLLDPSWPALDERLCQLVRQLVKFSCQEQATWVLLHLPTAPKSLP